VLHVEIEQAGLGADDEDAGDALVVGMPLAIREAPGAGNAPQDGDVRIRSTTEHLQQGDDRADHHAAEEARAEHSHERRQRHDELATIAAPERLEGRHLDQPRHRHQHHGGQDRLGQGAQEMGQEQDHDDHDARREAPASGVRAHRPR
jgi:hypothetical protein